MWPWWKLKLVNSVLQSSTTWIIRQSIATACYIGVSHVILYSFDLSMKMAACFWYIISCDGIQSEAVL